MKELLVMTRNREALDTTLQQMGGLVGSRPEPDGSYAVRAINGNLGFLRFAIENQGYAEVVGEREISTGSPPN